MQTLFIDRLSCFSLFSLVVNGHGSAEIRYFNATAAGEKMSSLLCRGGIIRKKPIPHEFILGEMRTQSGECLYPKIGEDLKRLSFEVSDRDLNRDRFLKGFKHVFPFTNLLQFFEKVVAEKISDNVVFLNAAALAAEKEKSPRSGPAIFLIEKQLWIDHLMSYGKELGLETAAYASLPQHYFGYLTKAKNYIHARFRARKVSSTKGGNGKTSTKRIKPATNGKTDIPRIAGWYTGKAVTFDLENRSDFFWMLRSEIPYDRVLIYFNRKDIPLSREMSDILTEKGVRALALSKGATASGEVPVWKPGNTAGSIKKKLMMTLAGKALSSAAALQMPGIVFISYLVYFIEEYAYWYDFFLTNNIKIHVSPGDFTKSYIPKNLALKDTGGISLSYQWSNLDFSSVLISNCSDAFFSFGPRYRWTWEENRSRMGYMLYNGYVTDYSFREVKEKSQKLRQALMDKGVRFIICFYDENSSDDRMSVIPDERSARTYAYFIERMLDDPTLGLIFKPGYPTTLSKRLSSITGLLEKCRESDRCVFLDEGTYVTTKYPTEAAQAADISVGFLMSGTVALESYLSGTPTVMLDLEKLYSLEIYRWGKGTVVFDSLEGLFDAITKYRRDPESIPGFGDLSNWAADRDPHQDGGAASRIEHYISMLYEKVNAGATREEAIEYANRRYAEEWGTDKVIPWH